LPAEALAKAGFCSQFNGSNTLINHHISVSG
jgi:hypothetical protein